MKKILFTATVLASIGAFQPAYATNENCGNAAQSQWMSLDAIKAKATQMGYDVRNVKIEDGCYEIYAIKNGNRVEAYLNPVTAEVVREKLDD